MCELIGLLSDKMSAVYVVRDKTDRGEVRVSFQKIQGVTQTSTDLTCNFLPDEMDEISSLSCSDMGDS